MNFVDKDGTTKVYIPVHPCISDETIALIKKKRRLRRQYSQNKDPAVKTRMTSFRNKLRTNLG